MEARGSGLQGQSGVMKPCLRTNKGGGSFYSIKVAPSKVFSFICSCVVVFHKHLVLVDNQSQRTGVTESEFWFPQNCGVEQNVLGTGFCHLKSTDSSGQL